MFFAGISIGLLLTRASTLPDASASSSPSQHTDLSKSKDNQTLQKKITQLLAANKRLGVSHQRLNSHRPKLFVPELPPPPKPKTTKQPTTPHQQQQSREKYNEMIHYITTREANVATKKKTDWMDLPTAFPYTDAASSETKKQVNRTIAKELRSMDATNRLQRDAFALLLVLDAPNFGTTNTLLSSMCPAFRNYQSRIVIPQADVTHYFQMINDQQQGHLLNVRCQRLDHWLCTNGNVGFKHVLMYADYECTFVGNIDVRLSPMLDVMRWFRLRYPHVGNGETKESCLLVLTVKLRGSHFSSSLDYIDNFIVVEGALNGYAVERIHVFAKSLTTLFFSVSRL